MFAIGDPLPHPKNCGRPLWTAPNLNSWMIKLTKTQFLPNCHVPNGYFCIVYKLLTIAQLFAQVTFLSVSLVRENLTGLRENLRHKIWNLARQMDKLNEKRTQLQQVTDKLQVSGHEFNSFIGNFYLTANIYTVEN